MNPHVLLGHEILSLARLPVPPLQQCGKRLPRYAASDNRHLPSPPRPRCIRWRIAHGWRVARVAEKLGISMGSDSPRPGVWKPNDSPRASAPLDSRTRLNLQRQESAQMQSCRPVEQDLFPVQQLAAIRKPLQAFQYHTASGQNPLLAVDLAHQVNQTPHVLFGLPT